MSDGVINSKYGAHERNLDLSSEIVSHNKSLYVKQYRQAKSYRIKATQQYAVPTVVVDGNKYSSNATVSQGTAYNNATVRIDQNRYDNNAVVQQGTAYNDTTIKVDQNRYGSNAAVQQEATYSSPPVRVDQNRYSSNAAVQAGNNNILPAVAAIPTGSILFRRQLQYSSSKNRIISVLSTKKVTKKILKPVKKVNQGISFVNTLQSYQNDVGSVDKVLTVGLNKADKLTTKVDKALNIKRKNANLRPLKIKMYLSMLQ